MGKRLFPWNRKNTTRRVIDELEKRNIQIDDEESVRGGAPKQPHFIEYEGESQSVELPSPEQP